MLMNRLLLVFATLFFAPAFAQVAGTASTYCYDEKAYISIAGEAAPEDVGRPGAWFIAVHHPEDATKVAFLTEGGWVIPDSVGKLVPYAEYPEGIPGTLVANACSPRAYSFSEDSGLFFDFASCGETTYPWVGYIVKIGYGVLTPEGEQLVATRRNRLDAVKSVLVEKGKWRAEYEDDDQMRRALVIKSLRDGRVTDAGVVPELQCQYSSP